MPEDKNKVFQIITNDRNLFHRYTDGAMSPSFYFFRLVQIFPEKRSQLFEILTSNRDEFHRLTGSEPAENFGLFLMYFSAYKRQLLEIVTKNRDEFHRFTTGPWGPSHYVGRLVRAFVIDYTQELYEVVISSRDELLRLTTGTNGQAYYLAELAKIFRKDELNKPTLDEAWQAIQVRKQYFQSKAEIIEKARVIAQGARTLFNPTEPCFFRKIQEKGIQAHIAGYTGIHGAHDIPWAKKPNEIAYKNLNIPKI